MSTIKLDKIAAASTSQAYAWYVVGALMFAYIVSGIDRIAITFLVAPIKSEFSLNDFEMGLLMGPAFGIFYALFGLPIGWLADFRSRRNIIVIGIVAWCAMTMACGFAGSFWALFATRIGVGIGEATLSPCALSIISDYHARGQRSLAVSCYMSGSFLGPALAFLFGASVVSWASSLTPWEFGDIGALAPWRMVFVVVGACGLIAALCVATIREPERSERLMRTPVGREASAPGLAEALRWLWGQWQGVGLLIVGMGCIFALGYTSYWMLSLFERTWHWEASRTGTAFALVTAGCAIVGTQFGGRLSDYWSRRGDSSGPLRGVLLGALIACPGYVLSPLMPNGGWAIFCQVVAWLGQAISSACAPVAVINAVPSELRSKLAALYFTIASLIGLMLGPSSVGWFSDAIGGPQGLRYALTVIGVLFGVLSVALFSASLRPYKATVRELERRLGLSAPR